KEHITRRNKTQFTRSKTELQGTVRRKTFECAIQCLTRQAHRDRAPEPLCALQPCFPNSGKAVLPVPNGEQACEGTIKRGERLLGRYCARAQGTERRSRIFKALRKGREVDADANGDPGDLRSRHAR